MVHLHGGPGMVWTSILLVEWHVLPNCKPLNTNRPLPLQTHQICLQRRIFLIIIWDLPDRVWRTPEPTRTYADRSIQMCVVSISHKMLSILVTLHRSAMTHPHIGIIYYTCRRACASKLRSTYDLPNTNKPPISESYLSNSALALWNNADIAGSDSRPYQMGMCDIITLIYHSDTKWNCLSHARYVTSGLDVKLEVEANIPYLWAQLCCQTANRWNV